jgi:hypothetical protein
MFSRNHHQAALQATEHATCIDFRKIFLEEMDGLHLLALLLTADEYLAGQCFVAGLDDSIRDNSVFRQWARAWSRRAIIKNAINCIRPFQTDAAESTSIFGPHGPWKKNLVSAVTQLPPRERFVFVISVLEGYSIEECSTLLRCAMPAVEAARSQALQQLAVNAVKEATAA